jgi:hypothetical protein
MFKKLMPKEEKYFEDFKEMISFIQEMAFHTQKIFQCEDLQSHLLKMKPLEIRCDELTYKITKRLNKTFITPFDREDIFALVKRLDDISDMLLGAAARVETFHFSARDSTAEKLASIISEQVKELGVAIQDLKVKRVNELRAVKVLEVEADKVYAQAMRDLFENEKDAIELIKKKEIIDILERTCDACQSTASVILGIFIKNS